jgi:ubiquitin C
MDRGRLLLFVDANFSVNLAGQVDRAPMRMRASAPAQSPDEPERFSVSSDTSDGSVEEILRDVAQPFVPPSSAISPVPPARFERTVRLPYPTRLHVNWNDENFCLNFDPNDTFARVKRSLALKCGFGSSWLTLENHENADCIPGRGSRCFRDFDDASTLAGSFLGCQAETFDDADAGIVLHSSHGPLRISTSRRYEFLDIELFGCDLVCEVKRRIEGHIDIAIEDQRILFHGCDLADDVILEDLGKPGVMERPYTILRLAVRLHSPIQIWIQLRNGERFGLEVDSSDMIWELKERIDNQEGIRKHEQRLFLGGREMADGSLVCDWQIQSGYTVHLVSAGASRKGQIAGVGAGGNESVELLIHDLNANTISSIVVGRRETFGDAWRRFGYGTWGLSFWMGNLSLQFDNSLEDFPLRSGTVLHFKRQFHVWVAAIEDKRVLFDVSPDDTIWDVKLAIEHRSGIPPWHEYLIFAGSVLQDERTVADYSISKDSTLHLKVRANNSRVSAGARPPSWELVFF